MKWITFFVKAVVTFLVLWLLAIYLYGDFYLADNIVPEADVEIDESFTILIAKDARFCAPGVKKPLGNRRRLL